PRSSDGTSVNRRIAAAAEPSTVTTATPTRTALSCQPDGSSGATWATNSFTATARAVTRVTTELRITPSRLVRLNSTAAPWVGPPGDGGENTRGSRAFLLEQPLGCLPIAGRVRVVVLEDRLGFHGGLTVGFAAELVEKIRWKVTG